ncbi:MAG: COX15/CtaA family protein [Pseudomonadales bacterium]|nr:COX15/CtaA family protein [Pseudomonadales bacterium]NRA18740.1 COX15/CtaA family protein [Oceanospirillaceae bacterium]
MDQSIIINPPAAGSGQYRNLAIKLVNSAIVLVLLVVLMGGWTRINDAGLSCPDWPGCFGQLTVPNSTAELDAANNLYPQIAVVQTKSWLEMIHRYLAGSLGLLILALALIAVKLRSVSSYPHWLSLSLLVLVVFQALLGMWTVTLKLLPIIVTAHLFGGLLTMVLLLLLRGKIVPQKTYFRQWQVHNYALLAGLLILFLQILLGGWTSSNYAGWGCSDWLACNPGLDITYNFSNAFAITLDSTYSHQGGQLPLAERGAIQISHRVGALLVVLYFIAVYFFVARHQPWKNYFIGLLLLTLLQIVLGLLNILWAIPTSLAMAHHFVAVLMLIGSTMLLARSFSQPSGESVDAETKFIDG